MKTWWLRFSCFITGYNYEIVSCSSWISKAVVLKNMSAMLSICLIWALIGFAFGKRYLKLENQGSLLIAVGLIFIVIQIERQIIMSIAKSTFLLVFRSVIGLIMALLGALILDQVIFSGDIEKKKFQLVHNQVKEIMRNNDAQDSVRYSIIESQIQSAIERKSLLLKEIAQRPVLKLVDSEVNDYPGIDNISSIESPGMNRTIKTRAIVNPNIELLNKLENELLQLRHEKKELVAKQEHEIDEVKTGLLLNSGFTEESRILFLIFKENAFALFVWICLTLMFFSLESLILVNKIGESKTDYDKRLERELKENMNRIDYQDDSILL